MKTEKLTQIIEQPTALKLDDSTRIDTSLGVTVGLGVTIFLLTIATIKNILNCYTQYAQMLSNVEKTATILADLKTDQTVNFQQVKTEFDRVKTEFDRINQSIHDLFIKTNSSEHRLESVEKILDLHTQKIELLEASTNKIKGKIGES